MNMVAWMKSSSLPNEGSAIKNREVGITSSGAPDSVDSCREEREAEKWRESGWVREREIPVISTTRRGSSPAVPEGKRAAILFRVS